MTVLNDNPPFFQYLGDGVTEFFAYTFEVKDYSTIIVKVDDVLANFVREETGVLISPAPADGAVVSLARSTSLDQLTDWSAQEAFKGPKTEDAQDKLIMLKQESGFNQALMNLQSVPFLDNVTLVNDVGTNAVIPIWGDALAGVFSGEVNSVIPDAGDVVAKPLDFVYMQYAQAEEQVLTTTLYPLEAADNTYMSMDLSAASMSLISRDSMDLGASFLSGNLVETLISTGPYLDNMDHSATFLSGTLVDQLISTGPYDDNMDHGATFLSGLLEKKLISYYSPDEELYISIALNNASMTPVAPTYNPDIMQYDGTTGYYNKAYTSSGNKVTAVVRFKGASFTGGSSKFILRIDGPTNNQRISLFAIASDHSDPDKADRIALQVRNSAGTIICYLWGADGAYLDDTLHTAFLSFDGDAGTATFIIDEVDADDTGNADRVAPTTGTLDAGANSSAVVGAIEGGGNYWDGQIGYFGYKDEYLTNWSDFMSGNQPKQLDEVTWTEWSGQPLYWNAIGTMTTNLGTAGNMTQNGTITQVPAT